MALAWGCKRNMVLVSHTHGAGVGKHTWSDRRAKSMVWKARSQLQDTSITRQLTQQSHLVYQWQDGLKSIKNSFSPKNYRTKGHQTNSASKSASESCSKSESFSESESCSESSNSESLVPSACYGKGKRRKDVDSTTGL